MKARKESYKGCSIEIEDDARLTINGKDIDCKLDPRSRKWSSRYMPYTRYDTLLELAQSIVRDAAEFPNTDNQS